MDENLKVSKEFREAFNLGYQMAKVLELKSPMFKEFIVENNRMSALQAGMEEYSIETQEKEKINIHQQKSANKRMTKGKGYGRQI